MGPPTRAAASATCPITGLACTVDCVRQVFAHEAVLAMGNADDLRAPGGAITFALCGSWEHEPPCPLAPHHAAAERDGDVVRFRVLFSAEPADEPEVRRLITEALATSQLVTPAGDLVRWRVISAGPGRVRRDEADHGRRLAGRREP